MTDLWNKIAWGTIIAIALTGMQLQRAASKAMPKKLLSPNYSPRQSALLVQNWRTCEQLGQNYQQVYSFETRNFYIYICRLQEDFFYYRQSKSNPSNSIFLPATPVYGGDFYQAVDDQAIYLVGINPDGYYSSVMENNNEIIFEPELQNSATAVEAPLSESFEANQAEDNQQNQTQQQFCTNDHRENHPRLSSWQKFIGQSPEAVGAYAVNNGHDFTYSVDAPKEAVINTTDGLMVIFNIEESTQTINDVCINTMADL